MSPLCGHKSLAKKNPVLPLPPMETADLRKAIIDEYLERCRRNGRYSQRAFAKSLGLDPSLLSKVIRGQRKVSKAVALRAYVALGMDESKSKTPQSPLAQVQETAFELLSNWLPWAILEIQSLKSSKKTDPRWLAKKLQVTAGEVQVAIERLKKSGYLEVSPRGKWFIRAPHNTWIDNKTTSEARKKLQKILLEKATRAIDSVPFEERDNSSMTIAVDRKMLPQLRPLIAEFRKKLRETIEKHGSFDEVYQLSIAFFPLTEIEKKNPKEIS